MLKVVLCFSLLLAMVVAAGSISYAATYVEQYEMDFSPEVAQGTLFGNVMLPGDAGSGSTFVDGIMTFEDTTSSGNFGLYLLDAELLNNGNYIVDFKARVFSGVSGGGGRRSMGFTGSGGLGRGLRLNTDSLQFNSGGQGEGELASIDMLDWKMLRVVVNRDANLIGVFELIETAPGTYSTSGTPLTSTSMGGSGYGDAIFPGIGFHLGSLSGGVTTDTVFQLDWVRVAQGNDPLAQINVVPEPSTLLVLMSGLAGLAGMARRRRI